MSAWASVGTLALLCFAAALDAGEPLAGTVIDQSGEPIPGAKVEAFSDQGSLLGVAVSDEKGAFALVDLPPQRCLLRFSATNPNFSRSH